MKSKFLLLIALINLITLIHTRDDPQYDQLFTKSLKQVKGQTQYWFNQIEDHYDYRQVVYWKQRYWAIEDYFNPKIGPVFLFICGESTCKGVPATRQWVVSLAQQLQGLVLVLEHRFYGQSLPFGKNSFTLDNMVLLNSQQALRDLAYFQNQITVNSMFRVTNNPWISVGGSYPGALSAWYRAKYPHLTIGAIASSAVIVAIENFPQFDEQIYQSSVLSGDYCSNALNASNYEVEKILDSGEASATAFKSQFTGGQKLKNNEFLFYWADAIVLTIQYGGRTALCDSLKGKSATQQFKTIVQNAKNYPVYEYGSFYNKNQTFTSQTKSQARQWYFQSCTEYGFWQTFSKQHPMRSKRLDINFYKQFCSDSYGEGTWPKVERKNIEYGARNINATNILFANGVEDPWRWATLQEPKGSLISRVANCTNCAHCIDLKTPDSSDDNRLKIIRNEQYLMISEWVDTYWRNIKQTPMLQTE